MRCGSFSGINVLTEERVKRGGLTERPNHASRGNSLSLSLSLSLLFSFFQPFQVTRRRLARSLNRLVVFGALSKACLVPKTSGEKTRIERGEEGGRDERI